MPGTALNYFSNLKLEPAIRPDLAVTVAVKIAASKTLARGTILGETATPGVYDKYDYNGSITIPKLILAYSVITDASGNLTGVTFPYPPFPDAQVEAYAGGYFDIATINTAMGDSGTLLGQALAYSGGNWGRIAVGVITAGIMAL